MKKNNIELKISDLNNKFCNFQYIPKKKIEEFYFQYYPNLTKQDFRRILYYLEKNETITTSGSGTFYFTAYDNHPKNKYIPTLSVGLEIINKEIREVFPYIDYLFWETKILHEFMIHQPGTNMIILETENGVENSVFNHLLEKYPGITFLDPDTATMDRYILQQPETLLVSKLITQTPMRKKVNDVPYATVEKILVDLLVDERYYIFQGQELVLIFENIFDHYLINEKSLLRYAGRRKANQKLKEFISSKTQIDINQFALVNL